MAVSNGSQKQPKNREMISILRCEPFFGFVDESLRRLGWVCLGERNNNYFTRCQKVFLIWYRAVSLKSWSGKRSICKPSFRMSSAQSNGILMLTCCLSRPRIVRSAISTCGSCEPMTVKTGAKKWLDIASGVIGTGSGIAIGWAGQRIWDGILALHFIGVKNAESLAITGVEGILNEKDAKMLRRFLKT